MILIKTPEEIAIMREGGRILAGILKKVAKRARPGVSTLELDALAESMIREKGGKPSFKNYSGYPAALCASVNDQVVHGIPSGKQILKGGDIVGLDLGLEYKGCFTDMTVMARVGKTGKLAGELAKAAEKALQAGIRQAKPGNYTGDIGAAIQKYAESRGFSVVRDLVGHGVGKMVHEEPIIPNFGLPRTGVRLRPGMTLAIEPMINAGTFRTRTLGDRWTVVTADGSLSAHAEHTVAITEKGCEILTLS